MIPSYLRLIRVGQGRVLKSATRCAWAIPLVAYRSPFCSGTQQRFNSNESGTQENISVEGKTYATDSWTNVPSSILAAIPRRLHLQPNHPITITRKLIESCFPPPLYKHHNTLFPVVSVHQNFDSLGFPEDHPGRAKTDTYYINKDTVLRTHTSAHQADTFKLAASEGYTISADVYRRDEIDRSHYPVFHQMEGARMWDRRNYADGGLVDAIRKELSEMPKHNLVVEDDNPAIHPERNPLQEEHNQEETIAISEHLKRSLEAAVVKIFDEARKSAESAVGQEIEQKEPLRIRWIEAYFPFTSPSYELEVFWQGDWLELLGCGVVRQAIPNNAGVPDQVGWAFGIGLERVAMLLYSIPDIRLFWSSDKRFLSQFDESKPIKMFTTFSKYPECYKDVAFWLRSSSSSAGGGIRSNAQDFHENDFMEVVREVAGNLVEDVKRTDEFVHPKTGRKSLCYRVNYRSLERTLKNEEVNQLHEEVRNKLKEKLGVELR